MVAMAAPPVNLPTSHPLITELSSLRQQLQQYQRAAHQSAIRLQVTKLELSLLREDNAVLKGKEEALSKEIEVLRTHPAPPSIPPSSNALTELTLAHRRLSAKLDLTESQLSSTRLELAASEQEVYRLRKEREGDRTVINELRRVEDDRDEEIEWERGERRKAEEQKKLCDLALQEYSTLVHSLDPSAVPPPLPTYTSSTNILQSTPDLSTSPLSPLQSPSSTAITLSDSISTLVLGQKGVHQLFNDFTSTLSAKEKALHSAQAKIEELSHSVETMQDQLKAESTLRVTAQNERDVASRDDGSAAKVVERYMTFTQKTHATVHSHLDNLRARSTATQSTLRSEIATLRNQLQAVTAREEKFRLALDEMSEGLAREAAGRRREVAVRLKMLAEDEKRERKVETWLDRVRRSREGAEGAVVEADVLEGLVDEGVEAVSSQEQNVLKEKRSWRGLLKRKQQLDSGSSISNGQQESVARVLLAEDLVNTLVQDLQVETERRIELEKQRVEWLAKDAVDGVVAGEQGGTVMFEAEEDEGVDKHDNLPKSNENNGDSSETALTPPEIPRTPSPLPDTPPLLPRLRDMFSPLAARYSPLQKTLHDLAHSLTALRNSVNPISPITISTPATSRKPLLNLGRRPATADPTFLTLLDSIHEVIEDARVDLEIALADEERVFRGFEALLGVGKSGAVQGKEVIKDAEAYISDRTAWECYARLEKRVGDTEHDLTTLKRVVHELEGMEIEGDETVTQKSPWTNLDLKTVSPTPQRSFPSLSWPLGGERLDVDPRRRTSSIFSSVGDVSRSFSASVIGAPRRVGSFAGGLYRGKSQDGHADHEQREGEGLLRDGKAEDDVE